MKLSVLLFILFISPEILMAFSSVELKTKPVGVEFFDQYNKPIKLKVGQNSKTVAVVKTHSSTQKLLINGLRLEIFPNSVVKLDSGARLQLWGGKVRVHVDGPQTQHLTISSEVALTRFFGQDVLVAYQPEVARFEVSVFKGEAFLRGIEREDELNLVSGQQGRFVGLVEEGKVVFDHLLQGRKVARGELTPVLVLKQVEMDVLDRGHTVSDHVAPVIRGAKRKPGQICSQPYANLNQCAWFCEGNPKSEKKKCLVERQEVQCLRRRCNALGEWADESRMPSSLKGACEVPGAQVRPCDY